MLIIPRAGYLHLIDHISRTGNEINELITDLFDALGNREVK